MALSDGRECSSRVAPPPSPRHAWRPMLCGVVAELVLALCGALPVQAQTARTFLRDALRLESTIGESPDVVLYLPTALTATPEGNLVLFDSGDGAVRAFSPDGTELWRFGRKGEGPGEFAASRDVDAELNGDVLVLDHSNRRVTRLSAAGELIEMVRLPMGVWASSLLPTVEGAHAVVGPGDPTTLWQAISAEGAVSGALALPPAVSYESALAGESYSAFLASGSAIVYRWSGCIALLNRDGSVRKVVEGVEPIPFPKVETRAATIPGMSRASVTRVDPEAVRGAISVTGRDGRLFVLFAGEGEQASRVVDVYDSTDGRYLGSELLPVEPRAIAALPGGRLATLEVDLVPVVHIWKIETPGSTRSGGRSPLSPTP